MQFTTETIAAAVRQNRIALTDLVGLRIDIERGDDICVLEVVAIQPAGITLVGASGRPTTYSTPFHEVVVLRNASWTVPDPLNQAICGIARAECEAYVVALKEQASLSELRKMSVNFYRTKNLPDWVHFTRLLESSPAYMAAHEPGSRRFVREVLRGNRPLDSSAINWLRDLLRRCYRLVYADPCSPRG
ncbi:hypothetical protein [Stagnihabitans tardus]|uniref:Uncharacterized protein n=1 Tax=Stagnihabitans tardus TaxID=2699202 RepID=A0AAE5BTG6_9RHOB|nr:hypothetical protein [Stagnihabitans tardus]NBZ88985.1 hypothetical protein [Stagnihabitans tardus]